MNRTRAITIVAATLMIALTGGAIHAAPTQAAPQLQRLSFYGETVGTFGDHAFCRGALHVSMTATPGKRGWVRLGLISAGFIGNGAAWARDPHCRVLIGANVTSARSYAVDHFFRGTFGPRPGQRLIRDLPASSGLTYITVIAYSINSPVRTPQSLGTSHYVLVP